MDAGITHIDTPGLNPHRSAWSQPPGLAGWFYLPNKKPVHEVMDGLEVSF